MARDKDKIPDDEEFVQTTVYLKRSTKRLYDNVAVLMKNIKKKKYMDNEAILSYAKETIKEYDLEKKLVIFD